MCSDAGAFAGMMHSGAWFEGWTLVPQDASGDLNLTPVASKACWYLTVFCLAVAAVVHTTGTYSETVQCARHTGDPTIAQFFLLTGNLATAGFFFEFAWAVSIRYMGLASLYRSEIAFRKRLRLNVKLLYLFTGLGVLYYLMAFDYQVVHFGWLAHQHGGHMLVYSVHYLEWTLMAPMVLSICGQLEHTPQGHARNALIPSSILSGVYCIISWQGQIVQHAGCAWALILLVFTCYFVCCVEQLSFAWHIKDQGKAGPIRACLVAFIVLILGVYGFAYLLPIHGWMTATMANKIFCVGDASFKLSACAMVMVSEDVCATVEMWRRAVIFAEDQAALIDTASAPVFSINCEGVITHVNERAGKLLHAGHDKILGMSLLDMIPISDREQCESMIRSALSTEPRAESGEPAGSTAIETSLLVHGQTDKDECTPVLELSASAKRSKTGSVTGVTLIGHDITAYKQAEERKARFMATMSHELRSPLHGIIGLSEHLTGEEQDESRATSLKMITKCSRRLLGLVVDIMDMASFSVKQGSSPDKRVVLHRDPVELCKIIEEVLALVKNSSDKFGKPLVKRGVRLVNEITEAPVIEADAAKCTQVFFNLVTNACKFTQAGRITVACQLDPAGEWVEVSVADTGSGISSQNIERIFKPFEQEDNSMSRGHDGLGLGLAIANEVTKMHGGNIRVTSKLGVGTTFVVRLPVKAAENSQSPTAEELPLAKQTIGDVQPTKEKEEEEEEENRSRSSKWRSEPEPEVHAPKAAAARRRPRKPMLLSVDDDNINQVIVEKQLGEDYEIVKAFDGEEACEFLKDNPPPDLVLLDYMMPGMHGMEVLKFIRQELKLDPLDVPVIMLSAADHDGTVTEALHFGCNDYIHKPFDASVLRAKIHATLSAKRQYANGDVDDNDVPEITPQRGLQMGSQTQSCVSCFGWAAPPSDRGRGR